MDDKTTIRHHKPKFDFNIALTLAHTDEHVTKNKGYDIRVAGHFLDDRKSAREYILFLDTPNADVARDLVTKLKLTNGAAEKAIDHKVPTAIQLNHFILGSNWRTAFNKDSLSGLVKALQDKFNITLSPIEISNVASAIRDDMRPHMFTDMKDKALPVAERLTKHNMPKKLSERVAVPAELHVEDSKIEKPGGGFNIKLH